MHKRRRKLILKELLNAQQPFLFKTKMLGAQRNKKIIFERFSSHTHQTFNRGYMTLFQDKLMTRTYCDEAGDYDVTNVLSPRELVFSPDLSDINWTIINR